MTNERKIDTHIHSTFSDGDFSIDELLHMIRNKGVGAFSITDHDCIDSCNYIESLNLSDLNYIRGVEISSKIEKYDIHVLGYDFNITNDLNSMLTKIAEGRRRKATEYFEYFERAHGIYIPKKARDALIFKTGTVGKANIIKLLHELGYGDANKEIYAKYLKGARTETKYDVNVEESAGVITAANGIPILAHPGEMEKKYGITLDQIIEKLINEGIQGIEVGNSIHTLEDMRRYLKLAKKYNLLMSFGSDYHGIFTKSDVEIGGVSKEKIWVTDSWVDTNYSLVEKIKRRK